MSSRKNTVTVTSRELPQSFRTKMKAESQRVHDEVLVKLGLDDRMVLIIGGAGYIGTVLSQHLLQEGYRVRCFDLAVYGQEAVVYPFLSHPRYQFVRGDLCDREAVEAALEKVSDIVLLAGLVGDPITRKYPQVAAQINDIGHMTLLEALSRRALNKVIFVSTCSNYGLIANDDLADEEAELKPLSLYARSKVAFEREILALKGTADFHATVLRFATAFGLSPRMRFDLTVNEFTREIFLGHDIVVYDPHTWRPYCHVRDFANVITRVLDAPVERVHFEIFNAGSDANNCTKQMVVDAILRQIQPSRITYQEHGSDPRNYRVSFAKIRERLYFEPTTSVDDGIREIVAAMESGLFRSLDASLSFYGNYRIPT